MIGTTLGHRHIVELIGRGGMGEVYRAYNERLDVVSDPLRGHFRFQALLEKYEKR